MVLSSMSGQLSGEIRSGFVGNWTSEHSSHNHVSAEFESASNLRKTSDCGFAERHVGFGISRQKLMLHR